MATRVDAFADDALGDADAVGLVEAMQSGELSAAEIVDAAVSRIERVDPLLGAVAAERYDAARAEARAPRTGYFAGLPVLLKDNCDLAGMPTQHGSRAFAARAAEQDGDVARMLGMTGAITLAKTRLSEYGFSASAEPVGVDPVRNPWDISLSSGASSAGSAALVAAGAVPLAHANDGGGSIRIPAACCGLVGLKPTRGRVPSDKLNREMPVRIVQDGALTRTVRDTAAFVRESERAYRNLRLPPIGEVTGPGVARLRIAVVGDSIGGRTVDADTDRVLREAAMLLESLGHHVEPIAMPVAETFADDFLAYWSLLALALERTGRRTFGPSFDRTRHDNLTRGLARHAARQSWRLPLAIARLQRSRRLSDQLYADYDAVLTPVLAKVTPELGWLDPSQSYETVIERLLEWVAFTPWQNATGDPAISLPLGCAADGLPVGVQLAAGWGHERRLLELAYEIEQAHPFRRISGG